MTYRTIRDAPAIVRCRLCGAEKPRAQVVMFRQRDGTVYVRPRCKACHNAKERGHRRDYKARYLRRWRKRNSELNRSYWQAAVERDRAGYNARAKEFRRAHIAAARVKERLATRGYRIPWREARKLLWEYGRAYPLTAGLNAAGRAEVERRRSEARRKHAPLRVRDIVLEVWESPEYRLPRSEQPRVMAGRQRAILARWKREAAQ